MYTRLNDGYLRQLRWTLVKLAKRIERIEERCPNYMENKSWIKCRKQQDDIYKVLRKHNEAVNNEYERDI